ncbi:hypothetical protein [Aeromonas sp. D3]|uniref:hypothetical protein n=1 Tax=Aeromonas sp. D3 TaxID=2990474 RepID=UPI0022DEB9C0|nr:hypothetical protein [Aeromonas sp. D3]
MNPTNQSSMNALLEQLTDTLEQTDLTIQERAHFGALLGAIRVEAGIRQEVAA